MRGPRNLSMAALLLTALLAGCASDGGNPGDSFELGDGSTVDLDDVSARKGFGAISGVVVDPAIRPVAGAIVTLRSAGINTTTADDGRFAFEDVQPGFHFLDIRGAGYQASQSSVDVLEGGVAKVKVLLEIDASPQPYHTTYKFAAFADATAGIAGWAADLFLEDLGLSLCKCFFNFSVDQPPASFVMEAEWVDSIPGKPTGATEYYFSLSSDEPYELETTYVTSPALWVMNGSFYPEDARTYSISLYPDDFWPTYNQQYEVFVTVFYLERHPDGWSFLSGDSQ
ncbi:MAG: carboxypeptidase-like regulatory domain-containing protein [Thermoplasmatota archaeon]